MSDVALAPNDISLARNLVAEIAGDCWGGKVDMLDRVYEAIDRYFRDMGRPHHHWTRRRIRAFWHREAAGVRYHEMVELASVAAATKRYRAEEEQKQQARKEHAQDVARFARLAATLAIQDEEFHRDAIEVLGRIQGHEAHQAKRNAPGQGDGDFSLSHCQGGTVGAGACRA